MDLYVNMHTYRDADRSMLEGIFDWGKEIIANGGKIVFFTEYTDKPSGITAVFRAEDDLNEWRIRLKKAYPEINV